MEAEKTELEKRVAGIEGMVANLIVDQQAMVTSFNARGDRLVVALTPIAPPVRTTLLFGSQRAMSVCLRYPIPVGHCQ